MEVILIALLVVILIGVGLGVRTVPQGQIWTVERFGRFTRVMHPGLNLMTPFIERVGHKMNVQEIVIDIPEQAVITRDIAAIMVDGIMYYRVLDAGKAAYGAYNLVQALTSIAMTNIRSVIGRRRRWALLPFSLIVFLGYLAVGIPTPCLLDGSCSVWATVSSGPTDD
jgi:regulator of protease activity HflC (stomatin/prohibitin superfamily)